MDVEIGTEAPEFQEKEYKIGFLLLCRVLGFFSSRRELGLPHPLTGRRECLPPPWFWG